jgi:hypothetical protein
MPERIWNLAQLCQTRTLFWRTPWSGQPERVSACSEEGGGRTSAPPNDLLKLHCRQEDGSLGIESHPFRERLLVLTSPCLWKIRYLFILAASSAFFHCVQKGSSLLLGHARLLTADIEFSLFRRPKTRSGRSMLSWRPLTGKIAR